MIVDDFDNDGLLDVVTSSMDMCEPMHFFHNNGDGTFTDRAAQAGLATVGRTQHRCRRLQQRRLHGYPGAARRMGVSGAKVAAAQQLRRHFHRRDAGQRSGRTVTRTQTAVWADIDNDGYLDLFVGNENAPSQLFRNNGDGTFEDISHAAGIDRTAYTKGVAAADYDNDGYVDFYVSNVNGANFLYHNNHDRTFTEVGNQAGVQAPWFSFADVVFRLRQRWLAGPVCDQLFQFGGRGDAQRSRTSAYKWRR